MQLDLSLIMLSMLLKHLLICVPEYSECPKIVAISVCENAQYNIRTKLIVCQNYQHALRVENTLCI